MNLEPLTVNCLGKNRSRYLDKHRHPRFAHVTLARLSLAGLWRSSCRASTSRGGRPLFLRGQAVALRFFSGAQTKRKLPIAGADGRGAGGSAPCKPMYPGCVPQPPCIFSSRHTFASRQHQPQRGCPILETFRGLMKIKKLISTTCCLLLGVEGDVPVTPV